MAPGNCIPHRLQAQWSIAPPARQQRQPPFQPLPQRRQRQVGDARRGELDRQRHAVQPPADVRHQWRVAIRHGKGRAHRLAALSEQLHRLGAHQGVDRDLDSGIRQGQWRHRKGILTGHPQQHPARHQDLEPRTERHQIADERGGRQHVLEVIQHSSVSAWRRAAARESCAGVSPASTTPAARATVVATRSGSMIAASGAKHDAVGEVRADLSGEGESEGGLADAAGAGQGEEPDIGATQECRGPVPARARGQ